MDGESDGICTPPIKTEEAAPEITTEDGTIEITETKVTSLNLLPKRSQKLYLSVYKLFMDWKLEKKATSLSESVLLDYFSELSQKYKSSTLWTHYSMLRSTLSMYEGVNIEAYVKLRAFLKRRSEGFQSKKANTFTGEDINKFLTEAPDDRYLGVKTALIMGVMGACQATEMYQMKTDDFQDLGSAYLINVPNTKTNIIRKFMITDKFYEICKKYVALRPSTMTSNFFFLNYQCGKCTEQRMSINKFTIMAKQVATYLNLPDPERYSGHSFRSSSANVLVDAAGNITTLKKRGRSTAYIDKPIKTASEISTVTLQDDQCTQHTSKSAQEINFDVDSMPSIKLSNCSNVSINVNVNK